MTIVLLRHGETALNAARIVQPADTPLSERGLEQARRVAPRIAAMAPAALVSSDLPRAWQTALAVAAATGLPIEPLALLHERNFGDLRGRPHAELGFNLSQLEDAPANGESAVTFAERVARAWQAIVARRAQLSRPLIVVTHGLVVHGLIHQLWPELAGAATPPGNTSVTILEAEAPHQLLLAPCTKHLDDAAQSGIA